MFDFKRLFLRRSAIATGGNGHATDGRATDRITVLAICSDGEAPLVKMAGVFGWRLAIARSSSEAVQLLRQRPFPIVLCDRDLPGEDWRAVVSTIAAMPAVASVLLASPVVDEYLWAEVIKHGGYDVVAKPFEAEQLQRTVTFAWSWISSKARRHA